MAYVALGHDTSGRPLPLDDPMADRLTQVRGTGDAAAVVHTLLGIKSVFGPELPEIDWWRRDLESDIRDLLAGHLPVMHAEAH